MQQNTIATHRSRICGRVLTVLALAMVIMLGVGAALAEDVDDTDITTAIESEFWLDEVIDSNPIDVSTDEGVVTLTGTVDSLLAKERTADVAANTVGVRAVVNRLDVVPVFDQTQIELEQHVRNALLEDPATDSYEIGVSADQGQITLAGSAQSWQERQLSESVAKSVPGVTEVVNNIQVIYGVDRPDNEIKNDIQARLANDVLVDDFLITVDVADGKVSLDGTVGSLAEKNRAIHDSWVAGTTGIDADGLEIEWWARDSMRRKTAYQRRSDDEIRDAVEDAFIYDPRVFAYQPEVMVDDGTVVLSGVVDSLWAKRAAGEDARNVVGVWRVKNHLKVRPVTAVSDEDLEAKVRQELARDPSLERWDIDVAVSLGLVVLSGTVNTSFEKRRAGIVAEGVTGVTDVLNNLDFDHEWVWKPDREIEADIHDQLWWSPFVDADQVDIDVKDGVATLTGQVDTWAEWDAAAENAFEGGAKDVRNELEITHPFYGPRPIYGPPMYPFGF